MILFPQLPIFEFQIAYTYMYSLPHFYSKLHICWYSCCRLFPFKVLKKKLTFLIMFLAIKWPKKSWSSWSDLRLQYGLLYKLHQTIKPHCARFLNDRCENWCPMEDFDQQNPQLALQGLNGLVHVSVDYKDGIKMLKGQSTCNKMTIPD